MTDAQRLRRGRLAIFSLCWLAYGVAYFGRHNLSAALPVLGASLGIEEAGLGILGTAFFWVYGVGHMLSGILGDRFPARWMVGIGLCGSALCNFIFSVRSDVLGFALAWGGNGLFQSMLWGPMARALTHWFPTKDNDRVSVLLSTSMVIGSLAALGLGGWLATRVGWASAFWAPSLVMGAVSLLWWVCLRERPEDLGLTLPQGQSGGAPAASSGLRGLKAMWRAEGMGWLTVACMAQGVLKDGIGLWGPMLILRFSGMDIASLAGYSLFIPASNFAGMFFAGWLNRRVRGQLNHTAVILLAAAVAALTAMVVIPLPFGAMLVLLSAASAVASGANTILLGAVPMGFSRYGCVSTAVGYMDSVSYAASGIVSLAIGLILQNSDARTVLIVWLCIMAPALLSMLMRQRAQRRYGTLIPQEPE